MKNNYLSKNDFEYAILYGIFGTLVILSKEFLTFLLLNRSKLNYSRLYLLVILIIVFLLVLVLFIYIKKIKKDSLLAHLIIIIYPYTLIVLSTIIALVYNDFTIRIFSYLIMMIIISWIQIYKFKKRVLLYIVALVTFYIINIILYGSASVTLRNFGFSFISILVGFIIATIHYKIYTNQNFMINDLDLKNQEVNKLIQFYKKSNNDLLVRKKITETMLTLTQEVLKNEKIGDVLQLVLDEAVKLIPNAEAGSILLLNGKKMNYVATKGYLLKKLQKIELYPKDLFQATLEDPFEPSIIKNLEVFDEIHIGEEKTKKLKENAVKIAKSCLTCSFKYNGDFFGSINLDNFDSEDIFMQEDKYLIKQLAKEIEIIISIHKLYKQALRPIKFDDLTGAHTRVYTMKLLQNLIRTAPKENIVVCTIDINQLKSINDKFGHDIGDRYLIHFANAIRKSKIEMNIFGRIGGDEFLLIFTGIDMKKSLDQIQMIRNYLQENPFIYQSSIFELSFAAGIAIYPENGKNIQDLIKLSDKRMYKNKNNQKHT